VALELQQRLQIVRVLHLPVEVLHIHRTAAVSVVVTRAEPLGRDVLASEERRVQATTSILCDSLWQRRTEDRLAKETPLP
jgi:hypothetical protein